MANDMYLKVCDNLNKRNEQFRKKSTGVYSVFTFITEFYDYSLNSRKQTLLDEFANQNVQEEHSKQFISPLYSSRESNNSFRFFTEKLNHSKSKMNANISCTKIFIGKS